jgi:hypothetical protein
MLQFLCINMPQNTVKWKKRAEENSIIVCSICIKRWETHTHTHTHTQVLSFLETDNLICFQERDSRTGDRNGPELNEGHR